jgi:hypothetical protein
LGYCDSMGGICGNYRDNMVFQCFIAIIWYGKSYRTIWELMESRWIFKGSCGILRDDLLGKIRKKAALKPLTWSLQKWRWYTFWSTWKWPNVSVLY